MKITISGAQSVGKTTLIEKLFTLPEIKDRFKLFDKTTRNVYAQNIAINENGSNESQRLIVAQHIINSVYQGDAIYDRCALDGYVYTLYLYNHDKVSMSTLSLAYQSFLYTKYDIMTYIAPEFIPVADGVRSISLEFRNEITDIFSKIIEENAIPIKLISGTVDERVEQILSIIRSKNNE